MLQPAAIFISLFRAIIPHELLLLFLVNRHLGPAPPHQIKSTPNGYGSQPSNEALPLLICGQRVEDFPESLLRGILGEALIMSDPQCSANRHRCMTPHQLFISRNLANAGAADEITIAQFGLRHSSGCQSGHLKKS